MAGSRRIGRRRVLAVLGGTMGVLAATGGGVIASAALDLPRPPIEPIRSSRGVERHPGERVLVAYASRCGSTAEIAEAIGETLGESGAAVDVRPVQEVSGLDAYRAVVLGGATRMGRLLPEATDFAKQHQAALEKLQTAYFTVGTTMIEDTPENRAQASSYLEPLRQIKEPVGEGLFAGKVDHTKLSPVWRLALSSVKEGPMADGDYRDWTAIRAWATDLARLTAPA